MTEDFQTSSAMKLVAHRLGEVESTMKSLTASVEKLVVIEERQAQTTGALQRVFASLTELERRIQSLEMSQTLNTRTNMWVDRGVTAVVTAAFAFLVSKLMGQS